MAVEMTLMPTSAQIPKFLRDRLDAAADSNARTLSGEIIYRLAQSFGVMPDGTEAAASNAEA